MDSACLHWISRLRHSSGRYRGVICLLSLAFSLVQSCPVLAADEKNSSILEDRSELSQPFDPVQPDPTDEIPAPAASDERVADESLPVSSSVPLDPESPPSDPDSHNPGETAPDQDRLRSSDSPVEMGESDPELPSASETDQQESLISDPPEENSPFQAVDSELSTETTGQTLDYEDDQVHVRLNGSFSDSSEICWQGPWSESDGHTRWMTFDLSLVEDERMIEPQTETQVDLLLKGIRKQEGETLRLLHRCSPEQADWIDVQSDQSEEGLLLHFSVPSFSEFVLSLADDTSPQSASHTVYLYTSSGQLDRQLSLQDGQSMILPLQPSDAGSQSGKFLGWSTSSHYIENGEAWKTNPLYAPGSTLIWGEAMKENPYRLYPVWARNGQTTWADFFIRLDGKIPNEPTSSGAGLYTRKVPIYGGLQWVAPYVDSSGIQVGGGGRIAMEPSADQLQSVINEKAGQIGYGARAIDGILYKTAIGGSQPVDASGKPVAWSEGQPVPADAVRLSMLWYVIKKEQYNWHVDGVLLESSKYSLIYSVGNAGMGEVSSMPNGLELDPGATVYTGHNFNSASGPPMIPLRAGYTFLGWQDTTSQKTYSPGETFPIERNTVLQALWKPSAGNSFTLTKYDSRSGQTLGDAVFELDSRTLQPGSDWQVLQGTLRTQANGTIVYDGLQPDLIYRLRETLPPYGYMQSEPFCFRLENRAGVLIACLCDEDGQEIESPAGFLSVYGTDSIMLNFRVPDDPYLSALALEKRSVGSKAPLAGAGYQIVALKDGFRTPIAQGTSDSSGQILWNPNGDSSLMLYDGQYSIEELTPPDGCLLSTQPVEIEIRQSTIQLLRSSDRVELRAATRDDPLNRLILLDEKGSILPDTGSLQKVQIYALSAAGACAACLLTGCAHRKRRVRTAHDPSDKRL